MMQDDFSRALISYLPNYLVRQAMEGSTLAQWEARFPGVVLVADLSGFTPLAEALARAGQRGDEELSGILNDHFSTIVSLARDDLGDVVQFSGDAITILFSPEPGEAGGLEAAALRAVDCAQGIQSYISDTAGLQTSQGEFPLQVRIGVGAGPAYAAVVGSKQAGLHHLLAGPAQAGAARALHQARPGEIVLGGQAQHLTLDREQVGPIPTSTRTAASEFGPLPPECLQELAAFLPPVICRRIQSGGRAFVGEHRRVVVLFAGFRELDFARDRAVGKKLRAYITALQQIIGRYDGRLNDIEVGDKGSLLIVLFGAPSSHEDDAERAVLCALEMQARVRQGNLAGIADQRIGLSSGLLFVGPIGGGDRWTYTAVGDEMNLAARLMERAEWDQIVTSARLRHASGERGHFVPLGRVTLKGKSSPVPAFDLVGARERPATPVAQQRYRGEMIGRAEEMVRILQVARRALQGEAQVLILQGEAGVGKSRLTGELVHWWLEQGEQGYAGDCLSYTEGIPYQPWGELLTALFDLGPKQPAGTHQERLTQQLEAIHPDLAARLPLLSDVLGYPIPDNAFTRDLGGQERQQRLFRVILDIVRSRLERGPLLLLFEDIHWSDLPSLELVEHIARNLAGTPLLLLLVHRPLDEPPPAPYHSLTGLSHCHQVALEALSAASGEALAQSRLGLPPSARLPEEIRALLARAQGNPLFIEEILNTLADAGVRVLAQNAKCVVEGSLVAVNIPQTVQGLVQARMDRLDEGSQLTLKVASVIGRTVPYSTLGGIYPLQISDEMLSAHLSTLEKTEMFLLERSEPEPIFFFKHIITHEVAYESLLFAQRQALHEALGQYLETVHAADLEGVVDLLAHHYHLGANRHKAFIYLMRAGDRAARAYTNQEALTYYRQAQDWLEEDNPAQRWDYLQRLEQVLQALNQREEQRDILQEMEQLAQDLQDDQHIAYALHRQGAVLSQTGHPHEGIAVLEQATDMAQQAGDFSLAGRCAISICRAHWILWDLAESRRALEQARQFFRRGDDLEGEASALNMLGNIYLASTAEYERALRAFRQTTQLYHALDMPREEATGRINETISLLALGAADQALETIRPAHSFVERSGDLFMLGLCWFTRGHALMRLGRHTEALEAARRALDMFQSVQERNFLIEGEGLVGRILLHQGQPEHALAHLRRACELAEAGGQMVDVAHFRSFEAIALLRMGQEQAAFQISDQAISFLEGHGERVDDLQHIYGNHFSIVSRVYGIEAGRPYLAKAYQIVQEIAADIQDPELRRCFLDGRENHEIVSTWQARGQE